MRSIHAIRESLVECGLLPDVASADDPNADRNYNVAWAVQLSLLGRGHGVPMTPHEPIAGMRGYPVPPVDPPQS